MRAMAGYTRDELSHALAQVELGPSNVLYVVTALSKLGHLKGPGTNEEKLAILYEALRDRVGPEGTITVGTWNYDKINTDHTYDHDNTPSRAGVLTEYIRKLPGAIRSLHPFESYTSIGPKARDICDNVSKHDFGPNSVYDRLLNLDAVVLNMGIDPLDATGIVHHAEFVMGVPYRYHKEFLITVRAGGNQYQDHFYITARFIGSELPSITHKEKLYKIFFHELGFRIGAVSLGGAYLHFYRLREMQHALVELLGRDPYGLLETPPKTRLYATTL